MATSETTNLQLVKYGAGTDNFIRTDYNGNLDKIDTFAGNTNQAIANLETKVPNTTFSSSAACIMGNFVSGYGCSSFIPLAGASVYTVSITSVSVFGTSGDKKNEFSVGTRYKTGFTISSSTDYSGKYCLVGYTATVS